MAVVRSQKVMVNTANVEPGGYTARVDLTDLANNPLYASPSIQEGDAYTNDGWAPKLFGEALGVPDEMQLGTFPRRDFHPVNQEAFYDQRDRDAYMRHSVQEIDADGRMITPATKVKPVVADVRLSPPPSERWTAYLSPSTYSYNDPTWGQSTARYLNGYHFSMADHRRLYDIGGMAPVLDRRNTQRIEPAPWDTYMEDTVPEYKPVYADAPSAVVPLERTRL